MNEQTDQGTSVTSVPLQDVSATLRGLFGKFPEALCMRGDQLQRLHPQVEFDILKTSTRDLRERFVAGPYNISVQSTVIMYSGTNRIGLALSLITLLHLTVASLFPPGAWDSHIHVIDPKRFPLDPDRAYTPKPANKSEALKYETDRGIAHPVIIQPSFYGYDNSALVDALKFFNGTARGVAVVDPQNVTNSTLDELHQAGVRGLRVNTASEEGKTDDETRNEVERYAAIARKHDWVLQIWAPLEVMKVLHPVIPTLGVRVVFDHFLNAKVGSMTNNTRDTLDPYQKEGFAEALDLVRRRLLFVKISAPYRISSQAPLYEDARVVAQTIMLNGPEMVVYGSDWPHTASVEGNAEAGGRLVPQDYRDINEPAIVQLYKDWCGSDQQIQRLFVDNPRRLWQWDDPDS